MDTIFYKIAEYIQDYKTFLCFSVVCKTSSVVCDPVRKYLACDLVIECTGFEFCTYKYNEADIQSYNWRVIDPKNNVLCSWLGKPHGFITTRGQLLKII